MTDREKLFFLIQESPMWKWFSNDAEMLKFADYLIDNNVVIQEWVPISNPPKERGEYLCYHKYEPISPDIICENFYYGSGFWLSEGSKVTHWMPLMKRPKED